MNMAPVPPAETRLFVVAVVAVALTAIGTAWVRRYALARSILDLPNARSSHSVPTPRGGGLAIAVVLLGGLTLAMLVGAVDRRLALSLLGGGVIVALVGWLDDHGGVRAAYRAAAHAAAAVWGVAWLGGIPDVAIGTHSYVLGIAGSVLAVVAVVWCINFYNFMDGIDGIAGLTGLIVGAFGVALSSSAGDWPLALVSLLVAAGCAGFVVWNWAPARIFMGDVGSGLLGFAVAMIALASERRGGPPALLWVILLGVFVVDATATLARRVIHGERWYDAHRRHAYQRLVQAGWSHRRVTSTVGVVELALGAAAINAAREAGRVIPTLAATAFGLLLLYLAVERVKPMYGPADR